MSVGNTGTQGNKKNNMPFQLAMLQLLGQISTNTMGAGADYELITYSYKANKNGVGYSTGDLITRTQIIFVPTGNIVSTLWFNQSTGVSLPGAPPIADIDAVLPATAVTVNNLPVVLGQALMINSLAVTIASDQSALPVTNPNLDVALSTLNAEVTQLLVKTAVEAINTKLASVARVPSAVNVTAGVGGTTTAGVRSCTLWFRGANGSVGGVPVPNNAIMTFTAGAEEDTLNGIAYVRPTTGEARIIITYTT